MRIKVELKDQHLVFMYEDREIYDVPSSKYLDQLSTLQKKSWWTNELEQNCFNLLKVAA